MTPSPKSNFPGPLNYDTSAQLSNDFTFRGRIRTACIHFAVSIQGEASSTAAHNTRYEWAMRCLRGPDQQAAQFAPAIVNDPAVQSAGDTIDDASLQAATENAITGQL